MHGTTAVPTIIPNDYYEKYYTCTIYNMLEGGCKKERDNCRVTGGQGILQMFKFSSAKNEVVLTN